MHERVDPPTSPRLARSQVTFAADYTEATGEHAAL